MRAIASVLSHLWYLVPEQVVLCIFGDKVPDNKNKSVASALVEHPAPRFFAPGKPNFQLVVSLVVQVCLFVTEISRLMFKLFDVDTEWLLSDPAKWMACQSYTTFRYLTRELKVVNDCAEKVV